MNHYNLYTELFFEAMEIYFTTGRRLRHTARTRATEYGNEGLQYLK